MTITGSGFLYMHNNIIQHMRKTMFPGTTETTAVVKDILVV